MVAENRVLGGLWLMAMNPVTCLIAIPLLMLMGCALLLGWLFIKTVELICRISRKPVTAPPVPHRLEGNVAEKW
jgi:hypothetical protein